MKTRQINQLRIAFIITLAVTAGCKHKKSLIKTDEIKKDTVKVETKANPPKPQKTMSFVFNQWNSFASKISIDYESDVHSLPINSFNGQLKMMKDQYIWMTIQVPILGEAGRVLITKDSVKILDRYNRRYLLTNFSYLQKFSSVPLSLSKLQNALIGNPTFELKDASIDTSNAMLTATFEDAKIKNIIYALMSSLRVQKNIYFDKMQKVDITAVYHQFETIEGQQIPNKLNFSTASPEKSSAEIEYSGILLNKPVVAEFNIPSGYKKWND